MSVGRSSRLPAVTLPSSNTDCWRGLCWSTGVCEAPTFGRIVYALVDVGVLVTQPGDRVEDFHGVYAFEQVFGDAYVWQGIPGA